MSENHRQQKIEGENSPSYNEIQKRAYELFLEHGEDFSPKEYWLWAEEELRQNSKTVPTSTNCKCATVGTGKAAKGQSSKAGVISDNFAIAEEERRQVRASEKLQESAGGSIVPRTKAVSVGQQRNK